MSSDTDLQSLATDVLSGATEPSSATHPSPSATDDPPAPRIRWAGVVWGLFFAMLAGAGVWTLSDARRRDGVTDWLAALTPSTIVASSLLAVGTLVLIAGISGLLRRAQLRRHGRA